MKKIYNIICMNKMTPPYRVYANGREEALEILANHLCDDTSKVIKGNQGTFSYLEVRGMKFIAKEEQSESVEE